MSKPIGDGSGSSWSHPTNGDVGERERAAAILKERQQIAKMQEEDPERAAIKKRFEETYFRGKSAAEVEQMKKLFTPGVVPPPPKGVGWPGPKDPDGPDWDDWKKWEWMQPGYKGPKLHCQCAINADTSCEIRSCWM